MKTPIIFILSLFITMGTMELTWAQAKIRLEGQGVFPRINAGATKCFTPGAGRLTGRAERF